MKRMKKMRMLSLVLIAILMVGSLAGCTGGSENPDGKVTISVGNWPAKEGAALDAKEAQKAAFEQKYPNITIKPDTWAFDFKPYYPKAAAGLLPTTYSCYFTEGEKIIRGGYAMEMTEIMNKLGYTDLLNPKLKSVLSDGDKIYFVPESCYTLGIAFNTKLFEQAGLMNADGTPQVPATWDELLEMAKVIKEKTGVAGFALPTSNNAGGWLFTSLAWSFGTEFMKEVSDGKWEATFNSDACANALQYVKDLKWKHNVFPANILIDNAEYLKLFSTGQLAMIITAPDIAQKVVTYDMNKDDLGMFPVPAGPARRVALIGGKITTVANNATPEQLDAAFKWFEYQAISPFMSDAVASSQKNDIDVALAEDRAVGLKHMQAWNSESEVVKNYNKLVEENVNVNINHFRLFNESLDDMSIELQAEEPINAQDLYKILDGCLQEVLNNENADCKKLVDDAAAKFQKEFLDEYNTATE